MSDGKNGKDIRSHITQGADQLFRKYGFKSVTMDDISSHLGVSKKTIYIHFRDKSELVNLLVEEKLEARTADMSAYVGKAVNAIEEQFLHLRNTADWLDTLDARRIFDLQKYFPDAWQKIEHFRREALATAISNNLKRGCEEGIYREGINISILTELRLGQLSWLMTSEINAPGNKYTPTEIITEVTKHFLYGISTSKGRTLIETYSQDLTNNN